MPRIPLGSWVESVVNWLRDNLDPLFHVISVVVGNMVTGLTDLLTAPPPLAMAALFGVIAWAVSGWRLGLASIAGFAVLDGLAQWDTGMATLSLVLVASVVAVAIAVPLGIVAARTAWGSRIIRPMLDFMQTMPAFVYLIPAIFFFGIGEVPGVVATVVFAMPPGVRLTELGIRQVDKEVIEAAEAFGTPPWRVLTRVQLPLALPTIMAGLNQVIMLALSMVVIAGIVGAGGLGEEVFRGITRLNVGLGFEAGLGVVILAIFLDRLTGATGELVQSRAARSADGAPDSRLAGLLPPVLRQRPARFAGVALAVIGLVAGTTVANQTPTGPGAGKTISIGYIPWDEDIAATQVWKQILERKGYDVKLTQLDAGPLYSGLAAGDLDLFLDAWLPKTHADYWNKYKNKLEDVGVWYDHAKLALAVPKYVDVSSIPDLQGKAKKFNGRIVGIEPGAGETRVVRKQVMPAYNLDAYHLTADSTPAMLAALDRAIHAHKPIVVTLWEPHWAYARYGLKNLKDPKDAFGKPEKLHVVAHKGFTQDFPRVAQWLKAFKLDDKPLEALEAQLRKVKGDQATTKVVDKWINAHQDLVQSWLRPGTQGGTGSTHGAATS